MTSEKASERKDWNEFWKQKTKSTVQFADNKNPKTEIDQLCEF